MRLLGKWDDVNPDKLNNNAKTPLWSAAWNRHERVVKVLLAWDNIVMDTIMLEQNIWPMHKH